MKYVVLLLLAFGLSVANAHDIYRWIAPNGVVHYSDVPYPGSVRVIIPQWPQPRPGFYDTPPMPEFAVQPAFYFYNRLEIVRPQHWETVLGTGGNVDVVLTIEPELNVSKGHRIQILFDGQVYEVPPQTLGQSFITVRGRHTVIAQVTNEQGRILISSRPVIFYVKMGPPLFDFPPAPDEGKFSPSPEMLPIIQRDRDTPAVIQREASPIIPRDRDIPAITTREASPLNQRDRDTPAITPRKTTPLSQRDRNTPVITPRETSPLSQRNRDTPAIVPQVKSPITQQKTSPVIQRKTPPVVPRSVSPIRTAP